jgi:hypothetical protein
MSARLAAEREDVMAKGKGKRFTPIGKPGPNPPTKSGGRRTTKKAKPKPKPF